MGKTFTQMTYTKRLKLELMLNQGCRVPEIAAALGVHQSTIYREIKRAQYEHLNYDYTTTRRYSPEMAQADAVYKSTAKGAKLKIGKNHAAAKYIEHMILEEKYSPAAVCAELKKRDDLGFTVCRATLYHYIDDGNILPHVTRKDLRGKRKRPHKTIVEKRAPKGRSIETRPAEVQTRQTFGHWEMDTVAGRRSSRTRLLVLTERMTRFEIIVRMPDGTASSVVRAMNRLERKYGQSFRTVFKTITVDNGSEFMDVAGIEKSLRGGRRTQLYFCHPYTACERGSNENLNRMIRWHFPKGTSFDLVTARQVQAVADWINRYPREILGFRCADDLFQEQLELAA